MDAEALQSLDRRFHYWFVATLAVGVLVVVSLAWLLAPGEVVVFTLVGLPVVLFLGAASIAVATGQHAEAGGHLVATVGWCLVLGSVASLSPALLEGTGVSDPLFLAGFGLTALGGTVSLLSDHGGRLRAVVSGS